MAQPRKTIREFIQSNPACTEVAILQACDAQDVPPGRANITLVRMIRNGRVNKIGNAHTWVA